MEADAIVPGWAAGMLILVFSFCLVLGVRLLFASLRTRGWPEFALGFFVIAVVLGNSGMVLAGRSPESLVLPTAAQLLIAAGSATFYVATWRVFRPASPVAMGAAVLGGLCLLAACIGRLTLDTDLLLLTSDSPFNLLSMGARVVAFSWWSTESWVYSRRMRRQEGLGLVTPGTSLRFALWSVLGVALAAALALLLGLAFLGARPADHPAVFLALAVAIVVANASAYVSFFRPSLLSGGGAHEVAPEDAAG